MNMLPVVQNVMAMANDMEKDVQFRIFLLSPDLQGLDYGRTEVNKTFERYFKSAVLIV